MNLKPYQEDAINAIKQEFEHSNSTFVEMPTGSGKTYTFLTYAQRYHKNILIIVPSRQLLTQVYLESLKFFHKSEISKRGCNYFDDEKKVHICVINSVNKDYLEILACLKFDLIIIDEAHHAQSMMYTRLIKMTQKYANYEHTKILGVTATPDRLDRKLLSNILGACCFKLTIEYMIKNKFLSDIEGYRLKTQVDIYEVDSHNGDFSLNKIYNKLCTSFRNNLILNAVKEYLLERKSIIFCINISHSKQLCKLLNDNNIPSLHIDGKMSQEQRESILKEFKDGQVKCIVNCQVLTEGFDAPWVNGILLARPTKSPSLFKQMIGRGLRLFPGKENCKIIDMVDGHNNLSSFNSIFEAEDYKEMDFFKNTRQLQDHIKEQELLTLECKIERHNFFDEVKEELKEMEPISCMLNYLDKHQILYFDGINFDEASFLIWKNELKKEYSNGVSYKKK